MIAVKRCDGFTIRVYISSDGRVSRPFDVDPKTGGGLLALNLETSEREIETYIQRETRKDQAYAAAR